MLSIHALNKALAANKSFVAPLHARCSPALIEICKRVQIPTIVMTRNIYDTMVSLRDRIRKHRDKHVGESSLVFAQTLEAHSSLSNEELDEFIFRYAVPWYFSFVASWQKSGTYSLHIKYEELVSCPDLTLESVAKSLGHTFSQQSVLDAITETRQCDTRLNQGVVGRGAEISSKYCGEMSVLASLYPGIDFSWILA